MTDGASPSHLPAAKAGIVDAWDARAEQWDSWNAITDTWFQPVTNILLERLDLRPGATVLELAAGTGGLTKHLARAVGPSGRIIATDSGGRMVELARRNLAQWGLSQATARVMDGEHPDLAAGSVDAIACRQAVMFFEQPGEALKRLRATLRPGGRLAVSVFSTPDRNPLLSVPIGILARHADPNGTPPPPPPGAPGPFSLGKPGRLPGLLANAGFVEVRIDAVPSPLRMPSGADLMRFYRETLGEIVKELAPGSQAEAWAEVERATSGFVGPTSPGALCELLVGSGQRPPD